MKFKNYLYEESIDDDRIKKKTLTLYHGTKIENVDKILKGGFRLIYTKPRFTNDYAVSSLTTKKGVERYMRRNIAILKFKFSGMVFFYDHFSSGPYAAELSSSPQAYTRRVLQEGIDASRLYSSRGPFQYFVYNVKKISNIQVV